MACARCWKGPRFDRARHLSRTSPAFRFCHASFLAAIVSIQKDNGCRFGARRSGSRLALPSHTSQSCNDQKHASELNPSWQPLSKIFTLNYGRIFTSRLTICPIHPEKNIVTQALPLATLPSLESPTAAVVLQIGKMRCGVLLQERLIRFYAHQLISYTGATA